MQTFNKQSWHNHVDRKWSQVQIQNKPRVTHMRLITPYDDMYRAKSKKARRDAQLEQTFAVIAGLMAVAVWCLVGSL